MSRGKTPLIQKDFQKGIPHQELQTHNVDTDDMENTEIYDLLISCGLFLDEQKVCGKWTRSRGELLYIDQHILNERSTRR